MTERFQEATTGRQPGSLAIVLQDAFTVTVRLRRNETVATDTNTFRQRIKALLTKATQEATGLGYSRDNVKTAVYAFTVFLDESVLNATDPIFADWPRQPLQEEIFGDHMGGENFFRNLETLLRSPDSSELADVLQVYLTCLILGFNGRYGPGAPELSQMSAAVEARIRRISSTPPDPVWPLPEAETLPKRRDRTTRILGVGALVGVAAALVLLVVFRLSLSSGLQALRDAAVGVAGG